MSQGMLRRCLAPLGLPLLVWIVSAGCQSATPDPQSTQRVNAPPTSVAGSTPQPSEAEPEVSAAMPIDQLWQVGPHSQTFVVTDGGRNSDCARCHAPVNWIPTMDELPESCLTCKFEVDPPPPLIPEEEWTHVECMVCHRVDKDEVEPAYAWLAIAPIEEYEEVSSPSELCLKCHSGDSVEDHFAITVGGAHQAMNCTECHDSHDGSASCADAACHAVTEPAPEGHDPEHELVSCVACHDAGDLAVSPRPNDGIWTTWMIAETGELSRAFSSHDTVLEAPCERCHYADNPWELSSEVLNGTP